VGVRWVAYEAIKVQGMSRSHLVASACAP